MGKGGFRLLVAGLSNINSRNNKFASTCNQESDRFDHPPREKSTIFLDICQQCSQQNTCTETQHTRTPLTLQRGVPFGQNVHKMVMTTDAKNIESVKSRDKQEKSFLGRWMVWPLGEEPGGAGGGGATCTSKERKDKKSKKKQNLHAKPFRSSPVMYTFCWRGPFFWFWFLATKKGKKRGENDKKFGLGEKLGPKLGIFYT